MFEVARSAFEAAHTKLAKYVVDGGQPASQFLDQVRVLDPTNLVDCERNLVSIDSIPGIESVSQDEWKLYVDHIGPQAVKNLKDEEELDLRQFWKSKASSLPELYKLASSYCTTTIGSYDVEQSFSAYNAILDGRCRSLEQKTMKTFHFLNWNLGVKSAVKAEKKESERVKDESSISEKARKQNQETYQGLASKAAKKETQNSPGDSKASDNLSNVPKIEESETSEEVLKEEHSTILAEKVRKQKATSLSSDSDAAKKREKCKERECFECKTWDFP